MKTFLTMLAVGALAMAQGTWAATRIGLVIGIENRVTAVRDDAEHVLAMKSEIYLNDTIRSGADARIQIMFNDDSIFSQGENSEMTIDEYVFTPSDKEKNVMKARLGRGLFRMITGKITDLNPKRFEVKTSRSTIGIRGCDIGCHSGPDLDVIYAVRIPPPRQVHVNPLGPRRRGAGTIMRGSGVVTVDDQGRLSKRPFRNDDLRFLSGGTTPAGNGQSSGQGDSPDKKDGGGGVAPNDQAGAGGGSDGDGSGSDEGTRPRLGSLVETAAHDRTGTREEFIAKNRTVSETTVAPGPSRVFSAGGLWAAYQTVDNDPSPGNTYFVQERQGVRVTTTGRQLLSGSDLSAVELRQRWYDASGNAVSESTRRVVVPLSDMGFRDRYVGFRNVETSVGSDVWVANDNKQEFVRVIDDSVTVPSMTYWGFQYPGVALPENTVSTYEMAIVDYPHQWDPNTWVGPPDAPYDVGKGTLKINTRTGDFFIYPDGGDSTMLVAFGDIGDLDFFGSENQAVAGSSLHDAFHDSHGNPASAAAGFRDPDTPNGAAEVGQTVWQGYAIGASGTEGGLGVDMRGIRSAAMTSDTTADNEGSVRLHINRGIASGNVNMEMHLQETPGGTPGANDLHVANPSDSVFVDGNLYAAEFENTTDRVQAFGDPEPGRRGRHWSWGFWNGDRDDGDPASEFRMKGTYVAGQTLSGTDVAALKGMAATHTLSGSGFASAVLTRSNDRPLQFDGSSALQVRLGGGVASWQGSFDVRGGDASERLNLETTWCPISANGHLDLQSTTQVPIFNLNAHGSSVHNLTGAQMTGNLVGSPGEFPTGAMGSGHLTTDTGIGINLLHASELNAPGLNQ